jgi:superfamily II DNA/RNA helicase
MSEGSSDHRREEKEENQEVPEINLKVVAKWMKNGRVIRSGETMTLEELRNTGVICEQVLQNLSEMGIEELFPVQAAVIPYIISGNTTGGDLCVSAPTGSGKTLAYAIPIVHVSHRFLKSSYKIFVANLVNHFKSFVFSSFPCNWLS